MDVDGSVALVTGGQRGMGGQHSTGGRRSAGGRRGIGPSIVEELLARGASKVYVTARTPSMDRDPRIVPLAVDVRDDAAVARLAGMAGDATVVVSTPGLDGFADLLDGSVASFRRDFDVDVFGLLSVTRAMAPVLGANGGGAMLNILSTLSWTTEGMGCSASRAAAASISDHARAALRAQGTTVTVARLGFGGSAPVAAQVPELGASVLAVRAVDALEAGEDEVLLDEIGHRVRPPRPGALATADGLR
ncbi:NAD(P)-dependent dehydrogenase (short-subunit alcohol dehydrogenase family) [Clavibacter sp. B3I6]|uniref:SDR family NAD(P)-dependent oxidoreductase n=1 Tax=Clavibacter sp. B3I6 TaxID=3042268 RepID=UPI0027832538|nr:SDR family NAD(P)-dependent oxidoreductase [Clavibacter sp. B3I6]MDQ0744433.1 NAD(P)-dependent dehydrogenase (short-subunit alcohol dehydrogenase family) [Clavibacter sp. B3I6]